MARPYFHVPRYPSGRTAVTVCKTPQGYYHTFTADSDSFQVSDLCKTFCNSAQGGAHSSSPYVLPHRCLRISITRASVASITSVGTLGTQQPHQQHRGSILLNHLSVLSMVAGMRKRADSRVHGLRIRDMQCKAPLFSHAGVVTLVITITH
jgi:hypothetical protein